MIWYAGRCRSRRMLRSQIPRPRKSFSSHQSQRREQVARPRQRSHRPRELARAKPECRRKGNSQDKPTVDSKTRTLRLRGGQRPCTRVEEDSLQEYDHGTQSIDRAAMHSNRDTQALHSSTRCPSSAIESPTCDTCYYALCTCDSWEREGTKGRVDGRSMQGSIVQSKQSTDSEQSEGNKEP
jgi:hypothetical protein